MRTIEMGDEQIPAAWQICGRCHGDGTHVNPAIDGNGISTDDECWEDDDFREGYFSGRYDVSCYECGGSGKTLEPDMDACTPEQREYVHEWQEGMAELREMEAMERRYGA